MESRKTKQYFTIFVIAALAICLISIFILTNKVSNLENQMSDMVSLQHNVLNSVDGQSHQIQSALDDFQNQQSWLGEVEVEASSIENDEGEISFTWQVKELRSGSNVHFNYSFEKEGDFTEVLAEEKDKGLYQISIPLELDLGPAWNPVIVNYTPNSEMETADSGIEYEFKKEEYEETAFHYFVSVTNEDGSFKNGDIQNIFLQDFGVQQYGIIETVVHIMDEEIDITLHHGAVENYNYLIEEVYLLEYSGQELIDEVKLDYIEGTEYTSVFRIENVEKRDDINHAIKVIYPNGEVFEQELKF